MNGWPEEMVRRAFSNARNRCECRSPDCEHSTRCAQRLAYDERGKTWDVFPLTENEASGELDLFVFCSECLDSWLKSSLAVAGAAPAKQ